MYAEHPGRKIEALLNANSMSRKELADRTCVSEKHISTLISGERNITASFARKLGYVFGRKLDAKYWQQLQAEYDLAELEKKDRYHITDDELSALKHLGDVVQYFVRRGKLKESDSENEQVIKLRSLLKISDLSFMPKVSYNAAYRAQVKSNARVDPYVLFAWQSICEAETMDIPVSSALNVELLKDRLGEIKALMFDQIADGMQKLQIIMSECGIRFNVVRNFRGAPVQGFIKNLIGERSGLPVHELILCLTLRGARADSFWFTLFHEIAHIINGDYTAKFVDFDSVDSKIEIRANQNARDFLIDPDEYVSFVRVHRTGISWDDIEGFAHKVRVQPFIVLGRLQNDQILGWSSFHSHVVRYKWLED